MKFPEPKQVADILTMLVGKDILLKPAMRSADVQWVSLCRDDTGNVAAAIQLDITGTLFLGGSLMMLPTGALQEQQKRKDPSEAVIEALSEVCNNLAGLLNKVPGNPHLRSDPTVKIAKPGGVPDSDWMSKPSSRVDLGSTSPLGNWVISILAK